MVAELFLGCQAFGVRGEIPAQVRPAELAARQRQVRVSPPAIGSHDRLGISEQTLCVILVPVGRDMKVRVAPVEDAPKRAALTRGAPPVSSMFTARGTAKLPSRSACGSAERLARASKDRVHRAHADPRAEQLFRAAPPHRAWRYGCAPTGS